MNPPNFMTREKIKIDKDIDPEITKKLIKKEFYVFLMKFIIALLTVILGGYFIWKGIESESIIKFTFAEISLEFNKALPGITLCFIGLILMLFSRLNIKIR